jgi:G2/mitotic-specific cyclin 1/2
VEHEAEVVAVLDADGIPEADPDGEEWDDLDAGDSEDLLMVSEYVVDIFKYMRQTEVRAPFCHAA